MEMMYLPVATNKYPAKELPNFHPGIAVSAVIAAFFVILDIIAIFIATYSGFTWFCAVVIGLFALKVTDLVYLFKLAFGGSTNKEVLMIVFITSGATFAVTLIALVLQIMWVTKEFLAVLVNPFTYDLLEITVANVIAILYVITLGSSPFYNPPLYLPRY